MRDLDAGTTTLASQGDGGLQTTLDAGDFDLSGDGGHVASFEPSLTRDGTYVAYASRARDLTAGFTDRNGAGNADVWLRAMGARTQTLVSRRAFGGNEGGGGESASPHVVNPTVGALYVAYTSAATDVVQAGVDASTTRSVFRRALFQPYATLVSRAGGGGAN